MPFYFCSFLFLFLTVTAGEQVAKAEREGFEPSVRG